MTQDQLHARLRVFIEAGLLGRIPTPWQIRQGTVQMLPYVISTDATAESDYARTWLSHPLIRQPILVSQVGIDHFRTGPAFAARLDSLIAHLHLTHHRGMPVFDLQIIQTHPGGLNQLRRRTEMILAGSGDRRTRRHRRLSDLLLADPDHYYRCFLGEGGWIARAERFDYAEPTGEGSPFPTEFYSLIGFLDHCAVSFPERPGHIGLRAMPGHLVELISRRAREGGQLGWLSR